MSRVPSSPVSLIDVALRTAEKPSVEVEVTHLFPPPNTRPGDITTGWHEWPLQTWALGETFTSHNSATALHLRTRRVGRHQRAAGATAAADRTEITGVRENATAEWQRTSWHGISPGAPDFLFDFADKLDVLLTLGDDDWPPSAAQAAMLTDALSAATTSAGVHAALPVTFVRSPSAGFSTAQLAAPTDGDDPLLARGATLRLTVGLDRADAGARVALLQALTDYARDRGLGLRVADRRYGSISGKWIVLQRLDADVRARTAAAAARRAGATGWRAGHSEAALLTVIGPSRQGSFAAVAAALRAAGIEVRAVTCLSSQDLAFVHTEVVVPEGGTGGGIAGLLARPGATPVDLVQLVRQLAPEARELAVEDRTLHPARGYQCLLSGPFRSADGTSQLFPVWASWEVREAPVAMSETGTTQALLERMRAHPLVAQCRLEYRRYRRRSRDHIVERVKLGVALHDGRAGATEDADERAAEVCLAVQQGMRVPGVWQPTGTHDRASPPRLVSFRVAPKERWLGTWLDDPS